MSAPGLVPGEQREKREAWERLHGPVSDPAQWDAPRYRAAFPGSAKDDDASGTAAAPGAELPPLAERVRHWRRGMGGHRRSPLIPLEQVTAPAGTVPGSALSTPPKGDSPPSALTRCPRPVRVGLRQQDLVTGQRTVAEVVELPCWTKRCEFCSVELRRRMVGHYVHALKRLPNLRFVTLTCDQSALEADGLSARDSRAYLSYCWQKLRKRLHRRYEGFAFCGAFEQHQSGWYHLHVVMSVAIDDDDLRQQVFQARFGAVCDVQVVSEAAPEGDDEADELARNVGYILSYACKDVAGGPAGRRAIINSEGLGYHSNSAKEQRAEYHARQRPEEVAREIIAHFSKKAEAARLSEARRSIVRKLLARGLGVAVAGSDEAVMIERDALGGYLARDVRTRVLRPVMLSELRPISEPDIRVSEQEWVSFGGGARLPCGDTLTSEQRRRFARLSRAEVTFTYRERRARDRCTVVHTFDRLTGAHTSVREPWGATDPLPKGRSAR